MAPKKCVRVIKLIAQTDKIAKPKGEKKMQSWRLIVKMKVV